MELRKKRAIDENDARESIEQLDVENKPRELPLMDEY